MSVHTSHPDVLKRLKRAHGHLAKVVAMVESGSDCLSVAQQLQAVVNALSSAKTLHVQDHIEHCLAESMSGLPKSAQAKLAEFREITKFL